MAATIKIPLVSRTIFYAPVWVAGQNGYFRDEGVDARFEIFDNAEKLSRRRPIAENRFPPFRIML